jgi:glycosyltransferase involved in cell wall biosynthesis
MEKKPIIAATDPSCDMGSIAEQNGYGYWCPSNDVKAFTQCVDKMLASDLSQMGENGYQFYLNNYTVKHTYNAIMKHFNC